MEQDHQDSVPSCIINPCVILGLEMQWPRVQDVAWWSSSSIHPSSDRRKLEARRKTHVGFQLHLFPRRASFKLHRFLMKLLSKTRH
jgi:hypothetical protein